MSTATHKTSRSKGVAVHAGALPDRRDGIRSSTSVTYGFENVVQMMQGRRHISDENPFANTLVLMDYISERKIVEQPPKEIIIDQLGFILDTLVGL